MIWYFCQALFMFFVLNLKEKFCKPEQTEDNSYNFPMGNVSLAMSWRSGSFQLKTVANKKVKTPLE